MSGESGSSGGVRDRGELLEMMRGASTPPEVASARTAADQWLAEHPDDDEVREALDGLEVDEGEELEEGGPT